MENILNSIRDPRDIRKLPKEQLPQLAREVRDCIISTVSEKGGHLGAGLGVTDLTIALHYVLNTPEDFLVFDVGHQVQAHKIITGRREAFEKSFRTHRGISGLVNSKESVYDVFTTGHGGPSISAALGVAAARRLAGKKGKVVAVIGDTSIANGMSFEALNHGGHIKEDIVVILNDNEMSISPSVGAMSRYLNRIISNPTYNSLRHEVEKLIRRVPRVGKRVLAKIAHIEEGVKHLLVPGQLFEDLGFRYFGPLDGHKIVDLVDILPNILRIKGPLLIHVLTQKGKGLEWAEKDPVRGHASTPFEISTGKLKKISKDPTYTKRFGETLCALAEKNPKIAALTGGMPDGTGLLGFAAQFPERFYDVGISEEHGVTFCAGLAYEGMRPVAAIYSTFLQRGFDQIIHDVALQNLPVMFCLDRGGLVGEDGPTHHGTFDLAYLRLIPNLVFMAPRDGQDFEEILKWMVNYTQGPSAVRYPRGSLTEVEFPELNDMPRRPIEMGKGELLVEGNGDVLLIPIGSMVGPALRAARMVEEAAGVSATVLNPRFVKPLDEELILRHARKAKLIVTVEEGCRIGGFGSGILELLSKNGISPSSAVTLGLPDQFVEAGARDILLDLAGLSPSKIADTVKKELQSRQISLPESPVKAQYKTAGV